MKKFIRRLFWQVWSSVKNWRTWVLGAIALLGNVIGDLLKDRFSSSTNNWLDTHKGEIVDALKPALLWFVDHPIVWPVALLSGIFLHAWIETIRRSSQPEVLYDKSTVELPATGSMASSAPIGKTVEHNVKPLGVKIDGSFVSIGFKNVMKPGELVGDFRNARLSIEYRRQDTNKEIATVFPASWLGWDQDDIPIGVVPQYAVVADYDGEKWRALSTHGIAGDGLGWEYVIGRTHLPTGELRIKATLIGEGNLSLPPYGGVLTLTENGIASFVQQELS